MGELSIFAALQPPTVKWVELTHIIKVDGCICVFVAALKQSTLFVPAYQTYIEPEQMFRESMGKKQKPLTSVPSEWFWNQYFNVIKKKRQQIFFIELPTSTQSALTQCCCYYYIKLFKFVFANWNKTEINWNELKV